MLQQIVDVAREHQLIIFSDEIYDRLVMDEEEHISIASLAPDFPRLPESNHCGELTFLWSPLIPKHKML